MKHIMRDELGAPKIVDRSTVQGEFDAPRVREKAHMMEGDAIAAARGAADWLYLAAAPTFGIMALLTFGGSPSDVFCSTHDASPLSGMLPMYALMSVFHSAPWLKLISNRHGDHRRS